MWKSWNGQKRFSVRLIAKEEFAKNISHAWVLLSLLLLIGGKRKIEEARREPQLKEPQRKEHALTKRTSAKRTPTKKTSTKKTLTEETYIKITSASKTLIKRAPIVFHEKLNTCTLTKANNVQDTLRILKISYVILVQEISLGYWP